MANLESLLKGLSARVAQGIVTLGLLGAVSYSVLANATSPPAPACIPADECVPRRDAGPPDAGVPRKKPQKKAVVDAGLGNTSYKFGAGSEGKLDITINLNSNPAGFNNSNYLVLEGHSYRIATQKDGSYLLSPVDGGSDIKVLGLAVDNPDGGPSAPIVVGGNSNLDSQSDASLSRHVADAGTNLDSQTDAGLITVSGANAVSELGSETESLYGIMGNITGGYVSHKYKLGDLTVETSGLEKGVLVVPNMKVGADGKLGLVLQYTRDSYDGFVVNGERGKDSLTNNDIKVGGVYLSGREAGRFADRDLIIAAQYLREMQDANFSGREVNMTGQGLAAQAQVLLPQLFQFGNFNLGVDVVGDLQTRTIGSKVAGSHEKYLGWVTNLQAGGNVIVTYDDLFRVLAGYQFRRIGNNEANVDASTLNYITAGAEGAGDSWKYGVRLNIPTSNVSNGLDGRVYVGNGLVKFEVVADRNQQEVQMGSDRQRNSTFYLGGNVVIGTDVVNRNLVELLTKKYRR